MFHVSNLKKCYADEPLAVLLDGLHLDDKLHFVEEPLEIVGREVKRLKRSRIPLVKVRWNSKRGPEFTWEREDQFKKKYPHLFTKTASSSSAASLSELKCARDVWHGSVLYPSAYYSVMFDGELDNHRNFIHAEKCSSCTILPVREYLAPNSDQMVSPLNPMSDVVAGIIWILISGQSLTKQFTSYTRLIKLRVGLIPVHEAEDLYAFLCSIHVQDFCFWYLSDAKVSSRVFIAVNGFFWELIEPDPSISSSLGISFKWPFGSLLSSYVLTWLGILVFGKLKCQIRVTSLTVFTLRISAVSSGRCAPMMMLPWLHFSSLRVGTVVAVRTCGCAFIVYHRFAAIIIQRSYSKRLMRPRCGGHFKSRKPQQPQSERHSQYGNALNMKRL
ncbi:hypothetical protein Tco_0873777 [Tanacetum coccineum]|uniref:Reverse transcriptase domain-containing protein n=1 Tax=Tanacetum coccineum TaxID=301880 RepID=A0ABQ5BK59_9ASTR